MHFLNFGTPDRKDHQGTKTLIRIPFTEKGGAMGQFMVGEAHLPADLLPPLCLCVFVFYLSLHSSSQIP